MISRQYLMEGERAMLLVYCGLKHLVFPFFFYRIFQGLPFLPLLTFSVSDHEFLIQHGYSHDSEGDTREAVLLSLSLCFTCFLSFITSKCCTSHSRKGPFQTSKCSGINAGASYLDICMLCLSASVCPWLLVCCVPLRVSVN